MKESEELTEMIRKRDGREMKYNRIKIDRAIGLALGETDESIRWSEKEEMELEIENSIKEGDTVEKIQDLVEVGLMKHGLYKTAKAYIGYRLEHDKIRNSKWEMTDLQFDIWSQKYEYEEEGFEGFLDRVSSGNQDVKKLIRQKKFLFGGRILASRGLQHKGRKITLSNCYVLTPPEDNIESIFETGGKLARTFSYGGGCGMHLGKLRPNGSKVNNSAETTSGATSFMELYSMITNIIGQKGRRGALMLSMPISHPDIEEFIDIKNDLNKVTKANISVMITDDFMQAVENGDKYTLSFLIETTNQLIEKEIDARQLFMKFAKSNWDVAEPGALWWDRIEKWNLLSEDEEFKFEGVNPCAEEPLPAGGSCLLGSINLAEFVIAPFTKNAKFDFDKFIIAVKIATKALNEVLDEGLPIHTLKEQRESVEDWRQIGLGIMGLHDMLIKLGIQYGSEESIDLCDEIGLDMINASMQESALLAKEFGSYPKFKLDKILASPFFKENALHDTVELIKQYGLRNSQLLTVAPTGSLSTMLGISGGIESIYQISYTRKTETLNNGEDSFYKVFTPIARQYMDNNNILSEEGLPKDLFVTAMTLNYRERIKMQAVWQNRIDASISSTVNVPKDFSVQDTFDLYIMAWKYGLKGVTIFRDGCRRAGILGNHTDKKVDTSNMSASDLQKILNKQIIKELLEDPTKCPKCGGEMIMAGGCSECLDCGYSPCAV